MNFFRKIFQWNKDRASTGEQNGRSDALTNKENPAFEYVENKYKIDCNIYRKLSSVIHIHSIAAAAEFAEVIKEKPNDDLVHFFFDYFLCFYLTVKAENFHPNNKDVYSALIDGLHIEFYGNVSNEIISSTLQLWATKNTCFLKTDIASFKDKEPSDRIRLMITIASYNAGKKSIGATEALSWIEPFKHIQNSKLSSIDTFFQIFTNH